MLKQYPKYKYILALADYSLLIVSFVLAVYARFYEKPPGELLAQPFLATQSVFILVYSFIWIVIFQHFNLYKINVFLTIVEQSIAIIKALIYGLIGMIVASFFIKGMDWVDSRAVIVYFTGFSFFSLTLFRAVVFRKLFRLAAQKKILRHKVLIIGTDETAKMVAVEMDLDESHGFEVVGFADDELAAGEKVFEDLCVVGKISDLKSLVKEYDIEDVIIAQSEITHDKLLELIDKAKATKANVRLASDVYRIIPEKVFVERFLGVPVVLMPQNYNNLLFSVYKRVFDFVFAALALFFLAIPFLIIAALIKYSSKGPVFFRTKRIGKDGKPFEFYKFRTMYTNSDDTIHREFVSEFIRQNGAEKKSAPRKITDDPRVTKIGKFLRKTSLDELPQLFNVLRGEMSLVGPRPCLPYEWEQYDEWHRRRFSVIPGCTGLWQVSGRSAVDFNDMVILDLFYIDNMSPLLDLKIIFRTIPVMLLAKGGY
ncbi:MAG TPA: sugar transferase [Pyrinomonadaceae bacterium]|jgi:undecaprenyl-phosphate galactose phosphotransferase